MTIRKTVNDRVSESGLRMRLESVGREERVWIGLPVSYIHGASIAQWVKRRRTDLAYRVGYLLEIKSSQQLTEFYCTQPFIISLPLS